MIQYNVCLGFRKHAKQVEPQNSFLFKSNICGLEDV